MKPTEKQIELAERLQKAGLCQDSKQFIYTDGRDNSQTLSKGYYLETHSGAVFITNKRFGPLPTFEEAVKEIIKMLGAARLSFEITSNACWLLEDKTNIVVRQFHFDKYNLQSAAIEALLYLKELNERK